MPTTLTTPLTFLNISTEMVNLAKHNMTPDEFIQLCKNVVEHQGYTLTKVAHTDAASVSET